MKNLLKIKSPLLLVLGLGFLGFLLRLWTLAGGPDDMGLYPDHFFVWCFLLIVSFLCGIAVILSIMPLRKNGKYADHFPASLPAAICSGLAALAIFLSCFRLTAGLHVFAGFFVVLMGTLAAASFAMGAIARYQGKRPAFWIHAVPCLYLCVRLFLCCRAWGSVTQAGNFLFPFLASVFILLAVYQLTCFDVNLGNRRMNLLWNLLGIYTCMVSLTKSDDILFYACMSLYLLTHLCVTTPLRPRKAPTSSEAASPEENQ